MPTKRTGSSVVEFAFLVPWFVFLFVGVLDMGYYNYALITAQSAALANERTAVGLLTRRMTSTVLLVKALGGGWNVSQLPAVD